MVHGKVNVKCTPTYISLHVLQTHPHLWSHSHILIPSFLTHYIYTLPPPPPPPPHSFIHFHSSSLPPSFTSSLPPSLSSHTHSPPPPLTLYPAISALSLHQMEDLTLHCPRNRSHTVSLTVVLKSSPEVPTQS